MQFSLFARNCIEKNDNRYFQLDLTFELRKLIKSFHANDKRRVTLVGEVVPKRGVDGPIKAFGYVVKSLFYENVCMSNLGNLFLFSLKKLDVRGRCFEWINSF